MTGDQGENRHSTRRQSSVRMSSRFDPEVHRRRSIRLQGYDYSRPGAYFVTMVAQDWLCLFGDVVDGDMRLNEVGRIVVEAWEWLATRHPYVELDAYVVMPNHLHGIVVLTDEGWDGAGDRGRSPPVRAALGGGGSGRKPLGRLVGAFKTVSTKRINIVRGTPGEILWQRNYYERVIRNDRELNLIREYIEGNPAKWETDEENPDVVKKGNPG